MARKDLIEFAYHKGGKPEHRGGFEDRFEVHMQNLTKDEAALALILIRDMQEARRAAVGDEANITPAGRAFREACLGV